MIQKFFRLCYISFFVDPLKSQTSSTHVRVGEKQRINLQLAEFRSSGTPTLICF